MSRILLTGAAGYLGAVICEHLLRAGHSVLAVDNLMYGEHSLFHLCSDPRFEFVSGDVRDQSMMRDLLAKSDVVVPLAAIVGAPACDRDPVLAKSVNLDAIISLNQMRSSEQLVVFPTTNSGYGTKLSSLLCTEDTPLDPISLYGETKVQAESELLGRPNTITLRLATVFGMSPRMRVDLLVNHFVYSAFRDGYIVIFEKDFKRNYVHIRDVADCFVYCIANSVKMAGHPYNLGLDTANLSKAELAFKIKEYVPNFYIHFAEVGNDPDKRNYIVSSKRMRDAGFEARRSLDDGILELLKGYKMLGKGRYINL